MPGAKKTAKKTRGKKASAATSSKRQTTPEEREKMARKRRQSRANAKKRAESGPSRRLSAAQQVQRNQVMLARLAEGWTWEALAAEAKLTVMGARQAVEQARRDQHLRLNMDPVELVERIAEGYQLSIGGFEAIASTALESENLAVAVGAKKGANDAREKLLALVQATGRLPQEMGALRHLIDIRAIAVRMLDSMDDFEREMTLVMAEQDDEMREQTREAVRLVRSTFNQLMGMDDEDVHEGTAHEAAPALTERV